MARLVKTLLLSPHTYWRFQDLVGVSQRPDLDTHKRELQAILLAVTEYHGLRVYTHGLFCSRGGHARATCHQSSLKKTTATLQQLTRDDKEVFLRIQWPLLVFGEYTLWNQRHTSCC